MRQLGRWKGLYLPTGVTHYSLPVGREQGRGGMNNCASEQVAFGSSIQQVLLQMHINPRGEQEKKPGKAYYFLVGMFAYS